jgi:hypothetical protein
MERVYSNIDGQRLHWLDACTKFALTRRRIKAKRSGDAPAFFYEHEAAFGDLFRFARCHHGTAVQARTGKRALQAHDVRSPPDYILFLMDQAGSLRPADEDTHTCVAQRD